MIKNFDQLVAEARKRSLQRESPIRVVVAAGQDEAALSALLEVKKMRIADGILVGEKSKIVEALKQSNVPIDTFKIVDEHDERAIGRKSTLMIREGQADIVMKGKIKTANLFKSVLDAETGLRTERLISDVFIFEFPKRPDNQLIMITDGGINLIQDLRQKISIIENAVTVAHALGNNLPKVAVLSAIETVNPDLPSTIDAAILSKMNQRNQISGCLIDGPLALDNAISEEAARQKGIQSKVAGNADILLCPNIEAANMLAKGTTYFASLSLAHVCVGARAPVLIPSRADSAEAKLLSIALSVIVCEASAL